MGVNTFPYIRCYIYVTNQCNALCSWCSYQPVGDRREIAPQERAPLIKRIWDDLRKAGVRLGVVLTGGEPTLRPEVMRFFLELCRSEGIESVHIESNGSKIFDCLPLFSGLTCTVHLSKHDILDEEDFLSWAGIERLSRFAATKIWLNCTLQKGKIDGPEKVKQYLGLVRQTRVDDVRFFSIYLDERRDSIYQDSWVPYEPIVSGLKWTGWSAHRGWQCRCHRNHINGIRIAFKQSDVNKVRWVEHQERQNGCPIVRQVLFYPNGEMSYYFT